MKNVKMNSILSRGVLMGCLIVTLGTTGCASITQGTTQSITVQNGDCLAARDGDLLDLNNVKKSRKDIHLECSGHKYKLQSHTSKTAVVGAILIDGGIVDMATGAFWFYDSFFDASNPTDDQKVEIAQ